MSITVEDCLRLPAFSSAVVSAGQEGLRGIVNSITVLEYADVAVISEDLFINHEICITAFTSIKDDPERQCAVLRRLKEVGIAAVVVYYIGIFVPFLDERLIATADEIALPLICMPSSRFDFRYSEMINDVMNAIYRDRDKDTHLTAEILQSISQLQKERRTISNVLRMLSDRLHCSFLLVDQNFQLKGEALWPMAIRWSYLPFLKGLRQSPALLNQLEHYETEMDQKTVFISYAPVAPQRASPMHLMSIDSIGVLTADQMGQAAEVVCLFLNMGDYTFEETAPEMIVKAILNNEPIRMQELANQHNIDTKLIQTMWILRESDALDNSTANQKAVKHAAIARTFMKSHERWALVDAYHSSVIMLLKATSYSELDSYLLDDFWLAVGSQESGMLLSRFSGLLTLKDARDAYQLFESCHAAIQSIYPQRKIFDLHDLQFAKKCVEVLQSGEKALSSQLYPLMALRSLKNHEELLETLSVYLLDADSDLNSAGAFLHIHKNTVKYRIKRIQECLGCDISKLPMLSMLYQAVALLRLMAH